MHCNIAMQWKGIKEYARSKTNASEDAQFELIDPTHGWSESVRRNVMKKQWGCLRERNESME
eukprot:scaffold140985_cov45-Prasinocladus_malaysianus.AAC.2